MRNLIPEFIYQQYQQGRFSGQFLAVALYVDISGFTSLTEALVQRQARDVEALTETLNAVFAPLVKEVHVRGGLIPLFAGDAFVALFPGDTDSLDRVAHQALKTAVFFQQFFASEGAAHQFRTQYGTFTLGIRIGLSAGLVQWGIPGQDEQLTFYFRGPAIKNSARALQAAQTGEVMADSQIISRLAFLTEPHPDHTFDEGFHKVSGEMSLSSVTPSSPPTFSRDDLLPFISPPILDLTAVAEFRAVCPVFISFEAPEDKEALHLLITFVLHQADRHGGYLNQVEFGDKGAVLLLLFGAPVAHENNVYRAVNFLVALQEQSWPIRWRVGLTYGTVWAGIRGGLERCEYGVIGDVVNLASRFANRAGWGEIWADMAVYQRLRHQYWFSKLGEMRFKGRQQETTVYRLLDRMDTAVRRDSVGLAASRQAQLAQLQQFVQPIFSGQFAGSIVIHSEAGMGKTRLLNEFQNQIMKQHFLNWLTCPTDEIAQTPLHPFRHYLREYFRQVPQLDAAENQANFDSVFDFLLNQLSDEISEVTAVKKELRRTRSMLAALVDLHWQGSLYDQIEPRLRFENTLIAFKNFVKAQALLRPVIIHIEGGHQLDLDSQQMLRALTQNMDDYPLVILVITRYQDNGKKVPFQFVKGTRHFPVELIPLTRSEVHTAVEKMLGGGVADDLLDYIFAKTNGNPYFVEQIVLALQTQEAIIINKKDDQTYFALSVPAIAAIPSNINAILISRLDRLPQAVKEVVQTAAVLGREFDIPVLSHMLSNNPQLRHHIQAAEQYQLWYPLNPWQYRFTQGLLQDAAYNMQLLHRRRELHRLAGEAIEQIDPDNLELHYADMAYHYDRADMDAQAAIWYYQAGEQAAAQFANDQAIKFLSRALELTTEKDERQRIALLFLREKIYDLQGKRSYQYDDLIQLDLLIQTQKDNDLTAKINGRWANYAVAIGNYALAQQVRDRLRFIPKFGPNL